MGRGRAKAKQTKVARQLKYGGPDTDLSRLQAELSSQGGADIDAPAGDESSSDHEYDEYDEYEDELYAKYAEDDEEDDD